MIFKNLKYGICSGLALIVVSMLLFTTGCRDNEPGKAGSHPVMFPDYIDVTVPYNIAPLNFRLEKGAKKSVVTISGKNSSIRIRAGRTINIPASKWRKLLEDNAGGPVSFQVASSTGGEWTEYKPFSVHVSPDRIDSYLTYRLIEPGYEVWNRLQLAERNLENFDERIIADNNMLDRGCINCHIPGPPDQANSFFHLRHKNGGTMIWKDNEFRKLNTAVEGNISGGVYGAWHPGGRFIAFSTNVIIPEFHSRKDLRIEVYDTVSDIVIADLERNTIIKNKSLSLPSSFETFPVFSADGSKLYFCSADSLKMPENYQSARYSLCSVDFDPGSGVAGDRVDTLISAHKTGKTLSHPKPSPDGKHILFTSFDYGNFPVWHREADLRLLNLEDLSVDSLIAVNSRHADSYHSWSSESRWFVFASKRENGMYGMLYLARLDQNGNVSRPFLLPQKDPDHYDFFMKSYNIPELSRNPAGFNASDVEKAFRQLKAEVMKASDK